MIHSSIHGNTTLKTYTVKLINLFDDGSSKWCCFDLNCLFEFFKSKMTINSLPDKLLLMILSYLTVRELFIVECVNEKWQNCVLESLTEKTILNHLDYYGKKFVYICPYISHKRIFMKQ